jgi:hypothetical protein
MGHQPYRVKRHKIISRTSHWEKYEWDIQPVVRFRTGVVKSPETYEHQLCGDKHKYPSVTLVDDKRQNYQFHHCADHWHMGYQICRFYQRQPELALD